MTNRPFLTAVFFLMLLIFMFGIDFVVDAFFTDFMVAGLTLWGILVAAFGIWGMVMTGKTLDEGYRWREQQEGEE